MTLGAILADITTIVTMEPPQETVDVTIVVISARIAPSVMIISPFPIF